MAPKDGRDIVQDLFDEGYAVQEEYSDLLTRRAGIRDSLRNLAKAGMLSEAQLADLEELYPERKRNVEEVGEDEPADDTQQAAA